MSDFDYGAIFIPEPFKEACAEAMSDYDIPPSGLRVKHLKERVGVLYPPSTMSHFLQAYKEQHKPKPKPKYEEMSKALRNALSVTDECLAQAEGGDTGEGMTAMAALAVIDELRTLQQELEQLCRALPSDS